MQDINKYITENIIKIVVRTTKDLRLHSISNKNRNLIDNFIETHNVYDYIEISTYTGENFKKIFDLLATECYEKSLIHKTSSY